MTSKRSFFGMETETDKLNEIKKQERSLTQQTYRHAAENQQVFPMFVTSEFGAELGESSVADIVERQAGCPSANPTCQLTRSE